MAAALGTLCFHGAESLPSSLAVLHAFLGAEQTGREKAVPFVLLAWGERERGEQLLLELSSFTLGVTPSLQGLHKGSELGLRGDTNTVLKLKQIEKQL